MEKSIAILQSAYIPWKGYFDLINSVDEFIILDDVQFTKNDWRNRNIVKTAQGPKWLTIPVSKKSLAQAIKDTRISDNRWSRKHWSTVSQNYSKAPGFADYGPVFEQLYQSCSDCMYLSEVNYRFMTTINEILGIGTKIRWSSEFELADGQTERLVDLCKQCNATHYVSGPAAKDYFDLDLARQENIAVTWMDYSGYPEYPQLHPPFEHKVTILDLLFNMGAESPKYMKSFEASPC